MARKPASKAARPPSKNVRDADDDRHAVLERSYRESRSAFNTWETTQDRTDQQLYKAIGRLAEFAAAVGNDHAALREFAAGKGVRATKASTPYTVVTKLIVTWQRVEELNRQRTVSRPS
jgi:hypothetical protein